MQRMMLALAIAASACGTEESGDNSLHGVWSGRAAIRGSSDTLVLWLPDSLGAIEGYGAVRPRILRDYFATGTFVDNHLDLSLLQFQSGGFTAQLDMVDGRLTGTVQVGEKTVPVTLERQPAPVDRQGRWVLTTVRGVSPSPDDVMADTLLIARDGRVSLNSQRTGCGFGTIGIYTSIPGRAVFEYLYPGTGACPHAHPHDTLVVEGSTLVRRTPIAGGTLEEVYERR